MHQPHERPRSRTTNDLSHPPDERDQPLDRNLFDRFNEGHRLAGSASGTGRSTGSAFIKTADDAFDMLDEAYELARDDRPINWSEPRELRRRTASLRDRISRAEELEQAVLEYQDALYAAGILQRRIVRRDGALRRRVENERLRADGTLYAGTRRNQNRPTHVDVDARAWDTVKREAVHQRVPVGAFVGALVAQVVQTDDRRVRVSIGTAEHRFARLAISDDDWATFRGIAVDAHVSTARLIGLVVEDAASKLGWVPGGAS